MQGTEQGKKPTQPLVPNWQEAPSWAEYAALDEGGDWYWYACMPTVPATSADSADNAQGKWWPTGGKARRVLTSQLTRHALRCDLGPGWWRYSLCRKNSWPKVQPEVQVEAAVESAAEGLAALEALRAEFEEMQERVLLLERQVKAMWVR